MIYWILLIVFVAFFYFFSIKNIEGNTPNTEYDPCQVKLNNNCGLIQKLEKMSKSVEEKIKGLKDNKNKFSKISDTNAKKLEDFLKQFD